MLMMYNNASEDWLEELEKAKLKCYFKRETNIKKEFAY